MALARSRVFQEQQEKEANEKSVEKLFQLKVVKAGDAVNFPKPGDTVCLHYIAYLEDGTAFDNSFNRGQPIYFILGAGQVISALEMVVPTLSRGSRARIVIPPEHGYGDRGYPPIIPPKATLLYEIEPFAL